MFLEQTFSLLNKQKRGDEMDKLERGFAEGIKGQPMQLYRPPLQDRQNTLQHIEDRLERIEKKLDMLISHHEDV